MHTSGNPQTVMLVAWLAWILAPLSGCLVAQDSAFELIGQQIGEEVTFSVEKDSFQVAMPTDRDKAQAVYGSLTGRLGGGSYGGSNDTWRMRAGSETSEASVSLSRGGMGAWQFQIKDLQCFSIKENVNPFRSLDLQMTSVTNSISCLGQNLQKQELVFLNQVAQQPKMLVLISGSTAWSLAADSAGEFSLEYSQQLSDFGAKLEALGVQSEFSNLHQELLEEIGQQITAEPVDEQDFIALVDQMESPTFEARENATKQIESSYRKWETMIAKYAGDDSLNSEIRSRLQKIIDANASNVSKSARRWIRERSLLDDSRLVFEAWKASGDQASSKRFGDHLRKLTDQAFEDNPAAWEAWIGQQHPSLEPEPTAAPPATTNENSEWSFFCEQLADLCSLTVSQSGHLMFDQQGWLAHFDGKSPRQLRDELVAVADKNNLPKSWILNGNNVDDIGPQHLLFQKLGERCYEVQNMGRQVDFRSLGTVARQTQSLDTRYLTASLSVLPGNIRRVGGFAAAPFAIAKEEFIHIVVRDPLPFGTSIDIYQDDDRFTMVLVAPNQNALIFVHETEDGFSIHDCRGELRFSQTAKSFADFRKNNQQYFDQSLTGSLRAFGINLTEQAGGPFAFKNKPMDQQNATKRP